MQNFNVDISAPGGPLVFYAMQADSLSRFFTLTITDGGEAWDPPDGALWSVRFGAPQMPSGWYDTIEDATDATHPAVNVATGVATVATVEIAEQAISTPGQNILCVLVTDSSGYQIASWPIILSIQAVPGLTAPEVTTYYNLLTEQVAQTLQNAQSAAASATLAESWAVGGTGTRSGEDTNNSEYWAQQAAESVQEAVGFRTFQGGAVLPINGDADLTQPLPTKTAASVSVTSAKNRIDSVTVHGFTTQDGSGAPSPSNVREISNAGEFNRLAVFDGSNDENWIQGQPASVNTARFDFLKALPNHAFNPTKVMLLCNLIIPSMSTSDFGDYEHIKTSSLENSKNSLTVYIAKSRLSEATVDGLRAFLAKNNMLVAYKSTEYTGKHYTGIEVTQGEDYHCTIVEINDRLHEGDTLETNAESEFDAELLANGSEDWKESVNAGTYYLQMNTLGGIVSDTVPQSSHLPSIEANSLYAGNVGVSSVDDNTLRLRLPGNADPKTYLPTHPLRIFYKSASSGAPLNIKRTSFTKRTLVLTGTETLTSGTAQSKTYFSLQGVNVKAPSAMGELGSVKCNMLAPVAQNDAVKGDYRICISTGGNFLFHFTDDVTTVEQAQQILAEKYAAGTPVTIEYELAEPEAYADTPVPVENPKGAYTVSGEDGTTVGVFVRTAPTPSEIGALPYDGTAVAANKFASPVNIGSASFNGTADITLAQMGAAAVPKLLWSGSFSSGSITVNGLTNYKFFKVRMDFTNADTLNTQYNTYLDASLIGALFTGGGVGVYGDGTWAILRFGCTVSGNTLTYTFGGRITPDQEAIVPRTPAKIYEIWGVA